MPMEPIVLGHPTRRQLVAFAESLVDRHAPVSALMAAHVAQCPRCTGEVKRIRSSLELAALAAPPEPSQDLTRKILARARRARGRESGAENAARARLSNAAQSAACVFGVLVLAVLSYGSALNGADGGAVDLPARTAASIAELPLTFNRLQQQTATVQALSASVTLQQQFTASPQEEIRLRALEALNRDMDAALSALERNPGCERATWVMHTSLERQMEGLRTLYLNHAL